jgi:hypothetical protein
MLDRQLLERSGVERRQWIAQQLAEGGAEAGGHLLPLAAGHQARRIDQLEAAEAVVDRPQDAQRLGERRRPVAARDGQLQNVEAGGRRAQWACASR